MSSVILGQDTHGKKVGLDLAKLVRTRMLIAASSGGGKSWAIRRLLEQTHGKVQQIVLDYEGEFATLREQYDFVLVGKGGELAADPRYAAQLARRLLERELRTRPQPQISIAEPVRVEIPVISDDQVKKLEQAARLLAEARGKFEQSITEAARRLNDAIAESVKVGQQILDAVTAVRANGARPAAIAQRRLAPVSQTRPIVSPQRPAVSSSRPSASSPAAFVSDQLAAAKGEWIILAAAAQHPSGVTREQLTVLTGYKRSSRDTYLQRLRARGHVAIAGGRIQATEEGIAALGSDYEPLPTGRELQDYWLQRLPVGEKAILDVLVGAYPEAVDREALSETTGYRRSSRDTYIQRLSSRELVTTDRGTVRASALLFD